MREVEQLFKARREAMREQLSEVHRRYSLHGDRYTVSALHNRLVIYRAVIENFDDVVSEHRRLYEIFFSVADKLIIRRGLRSE